MTRAPRRHWTAEFHRVDAENNNTLASYRQRAASLEADLAGARGRLSAVEESLAASRQRCSQLEGELAVVKTRAPAATVAGAPQRAGAGKLRSAGVVVRRRKL